MKTTIGNWSRGYVKKKKTTVKKATAWLKLCQLLCVYLQNIITQARKTGEQLVNTIKCQQHLKQKDKQNKQPQ